MGVGRCRTFFKRAYFQESDGARTKLIKNLEIIGIKCSKRGGKPEKREHGVQSKKQVEGFAKQTVLFLKDQPEEGKERTGARGSRENQTVTA